jgi:hypothetical protein
MAPEFFGFSSSQNHFFFFVFDLLLEKGHELLFSVIEMSALVSTGMELAMSSDGHLFEHDLMKFFFLGVGFDNFMIQKILHWDCGLGSLIGPTGD